MTKAIKESVISVLKGAAIAHYSIYTCLGNGSLVGSGSGEDAAYAWRLLGHQRAQHRDENLWLPLKLRFSSLVSILPSTNVASTIRWLHFFDHVQSQESEAQHHSHHFSKWIFATFHILCPCLHSLLLPFIFPSYSHSHQFKNVSLFCFSLGETVPPPCPVILHF